MTESGNYEQIPPMPPMVWQAIWKINKRGKEALVTVRNGCVKVLENDKKLTYRADISEN